MAKMPSHLDLLNPVLQALTELGGSGTIEELAEHSIRIMELPESLTEIPHGKGSETEVEYRLAWARNYLKNAGYIENPRRKVWALTPAGRDVKSVDPKAVSRIVRAKFAKNRKTKKDKKPDVIDQIEEGWRDQLRDTLLSMKPDAFERLCQRLLRESGFIEVEVTGRSGDGGIDGHGIIQLAGLVSFTVIFQAKRYNSYIGASVVRVFRGAMVGRADKGLIITTASFTRDARSEATRDGAPPIDLINGEALIDRLKELGLGVSVRKRVVEDITVHPDWFRSL